MKCSHKFHLALETSDKCIKLIEIDLLTYLLLLRLVMVWLVAVGCVGLGFQRQFKVQHE
jgi:hypothetical protein